MAKKESKSAKKSKRELSSKQKENLKKGQKALAERRAKAKIEKETESIFESSGFGETSLDNNPSEIEEKTDIADAYNPAPAVPGNIFDFGGTTPQTTDNEIPGALDQDEIWEFAYKKLSPIGQAPEFYIYRYNQYVDRVFYPFSWAKVKDQYGGGYYKVQAKNAQNQIIKTSTMQIATELGEPGNKQSATAAQQIQAQVSATSDPGTMMTKVAEILQGIQDRAKNESRERELSTRNDNSGFNTMMINMMQNQSKTQSDANAQLMRFQMESMKQTNEMMGKITEKFSDAIKELGSTKSKDDMGPLALMQLLEKQRENAKSEMREMMEIIDKKLEAELERRSEKDDSEDEDGEPDNESSSDAIIKAFVPMLAEKMLGRSQGPQAQLPPGPAQPTIEQVHAHYTAELERLLADQDRKYQNEISKLRTRVVKSPVPASPEKKFNAVKPSEGGNGSAKVADAIKSGSKTSPAARPATPPPTPSPSPSPSPQAQESFLSHVQQLILPAIIVDLNLGKNPAVTAQQCVKTLTENRIPVKKVVESLSFDDIKAIVKDLGLSEPQHRWLEDLYANIEAYAGLRPANRRTAPGASVQIS